MRMPTVGRTEITRALMGGLLSAGVGCYLVSTGDSNPRKIRMWWGREASEAWIYCWNLTHGGGGRSENEYRIQKTGIPETLPQREGGPTLVLGFHAASGCFAGFDPEHHGNNPGTSSSAQIPLSTLEEAAIRGAHLHNKANGEVVVAFRPEYLFPYVLRFDEVHRSESVESLFETLAEAGDRGFTESEGAVEYRRLREARQTTTYTRDPTFRPRVTRAYGQKCAVSGMQLGLIDAAHILPVQGGGPDETWNGIALTPTLHRAFDAGLIYLSTDLVMRINEAQVDRLHGVGLAGGQRSLREILGRPIALPRSPEDWPSKVMIREGNEFRGVRAS